MKYSEAQRAWSGTLEETPDIEVIVAGDSTAPDAKRMQTFETVLHALPATQEKAEKLLRPFVREQGTLELTRILLGQETDKLDCDFILHFILLPLIDPRNYDTYLDVCFYSRPGHPSEAYRLHPFKFVVGFY